MIVRFEMKRVLLVMTFICALMALSAVSIEHFSPKFYFFGTDVELRLNVLDGMDQIDNCTIVYSEKGKEIWKRENMEAETTGSYWFIGEISANDVRDLDIQYYFEIKLVNGDLMRLPDKAALEPLYELSPGAAMGDKSDAFVLLSDEPNPGAGQEYLFAVSFFDLADTIDTKSIQVWVGGRDVTRKSVITDNAILYRDPSPTPGDYKAMVTAKVGGKQVYSELWTTHVASRKKLSFLPMNLRGNIGFVSNVYDYNPSATANLLETVDDAAGQLDVYGNYGMLNLQTNIFMSTLEDPDQQPVNRYMVGMQLPVLDVFVGDYSPTISTFTMANKNVRGLYSRFHTRYLSLVYAGGEMLRKTKYDLLDDGISHTQGTYSQEALAARFQIGSEGGVMLGFSGSRNRDIISSLDPSEYSYTNTNGETVITTLPQDNAVLSADLRIAVPEQNVVLGADIAGSLYNYNTLPGPISADELQDYLPDDFPLDIDPADYADYFVLNQNMEPLMPRIENLAWQGYLRMLIFGNYLDARYTEVGPAFNSLSTYYQQKDTRSISLSDQINILNMVYLSGGASLLTDNVSGTKNETNATLSWNGQLTVRPAKLPYLRAGVFNNDVSNEENTEINDPNFTFNPFKRKSQSISAGIGYLFYMIPYVPSSLDITYRTGMDDSRTGTAELTEYENLNNSISLSMNNKFSIVPLKTQFVFTIYNSSRDTSINTGIYPLYDNQNTNLFLNAEYALFNKKLRPFASYRMLKLQGDQNPQQYDYLTFGLEASPIRDMNISTELGKQYYKDETTSTNNYDNLTWRFKISQRF